MARKEAQPPDPGDRYVALSGGPRDGSWETVGHWQQTLQVARLDGETPHQGRTLGYIETTGTESHPRFNLAGTVWRWNPDRAVELAEQDTGR